MFATQVLPEDKRDTGAEDESVSDIVGFIIVENKKYEVKKGETKIGRDSTLCSVVIDNCTISKVHAAIESDGVDDSFIYDVGSTNQTKLGKKVLRPLCRYKLDDNSNLTFGNISAKFVLPSKSTISDSVNLSSLDELGDIFDVATQVCVPQTSTPSKIPVFEKKEKIYSFKIPNSLPIKVKESPKNELIQCKVESPETKSRTEYNTLENSNIFNLNTQCQIYEPSANKGNKCEGSDANLLNDGQDDVLCTFMSLHSPKTETNVIIKTECENSSQDLDKTAQEHENEPKQLDEVPNKLHKSNLTSTSVNHKSLQNQPSVRNDDSYTQNLEEDFIKTQEFNLDLAKNASQNMNNEPYLEETLDDFSTRDEINEDLILTQVYEAVEKSHQTSTTAVILESEDLHGSKEDFRETQAFDVEKDGKKSHLDEMIDFTQRNDEDDFVATQIFEEEPAGKNDEGSNPIDDDDLIATQPVVIKKTESFKNLPETFSRENSPDLLCSGSARKNSEDFISTQIFECKNSTSEKIDSGFLSHFIKQSDCSIESSGDETESDLEILLEKNEINKNEPIKKSFKAESQSENITQFKNLMTQEDDNSYVFELDSDEHLEQIKTTNFEHKQATNLPDLNDSDATDCEEIASVSPKILIKQEFVEKIEFEETQVLTLTPPDYSAEKASGSKNDLTIGIESPRFEAENEPWSPLSLEMPSTQDIESSLNKILRNENEKTGDFHTPSKIQKTNTGISNSGEVSNVTTTERQIDSPLKRSFDSHNTEVVPVKKSKTEISLQSTEKQLSKLVQTHDIAQIQPSRTRNSLRLLTTENKQKNDNYLKNATNERPTSRRKSNPKKGRPKRVNGDITSHLATEKKSKKEASLKENRADPKSVVVCSRVLRSALRNSVSPVLAESSSRNISNRHTRRSSRISKEYYQNRRVNVVFTGFDNENLEKIIFELGGEKTNDLSRGEVVVVADKVRRTVKFLCAIGLTLPIASPEWLLSSKKEKKFLDPWNFILRDEESEEKWDFDLRISLERSKYSKLLQGFNVFATESTKPPVNDILAIVQCCGGTPLFNPPDIWPKKTIILSCLEDKKFWPLAKLRNVKVVHYEFILSGVLRQKLDFKSYELR